MRTQLLRLSLAAVLTRCCRRDGGAGPDLPQQAVPLHRAVPGRRRDRCRGARHAAAARKDLRPDRRDRQPRRRRRGDRPRRDREVGARRLHLRHRAGRRDERQSGDAGEDAVRCPQGPHGDQRPCANAVHSCRSGELPGQHVAGGDRQGQGRARHLDHRARRQRHLDVLHGAAVHHHGRREDGPRAVPRHGAGGDRPDRRAHRARHRRSAAGPGRAPRRPHQGDRDLIQDRARRSSRTLRPSTSRA